MGFRVGQLDVRFKLGLLQEEKIRFGVCGLGRGFQCWIGWHEIWGWTVGCEI